MSEEKDPYLELLDGQIRALRHLTTENLGCRIGALGHQWVAVKPDWSPKVKGVQPVAKQCVICTTIVRYNISARYGEYLSSPVYDYPDDYKLPHAGERIRPQAVRAVWAKKMKDAVLPDIVPHPVLVDGE